MLSQPVANHLKKSGMQQIVGRGIVVNLKLCGLNKTLAIIVSGVSILVLLIRKRSVK